MKRKLRIRFGFGETVAFEESGSDALNTSASKCETNLLSNHPKRPALSLCAGRITVDAREKD
jgi:hypothetical protein